MLMRILLVLGAMLVATATFAQSAPPTAGDKPAVKPEAAASNTKSIAERLQACLKTDDGTKSRLDCFDAVLRPQPKPNPATPKKVMDCRYTKEEDERLACFNAFTEQIPKFSR
jgi:hypothetical protein